MTKCSKSSCAYRLVDGMCNGGRGYPCSYGIVEEKNDNSEQKMDCCDGCTFASRTSNGKCNYADVCAYMVMVGASR